MSSMACTSACRAAPSVAGSSGKSPVALAAAVHAPRRPHGGRRGAIVAAPRAFGGDPLLADAATDSVTVISQVVTTGVLAVGAYVLLGEPSAPEETPGQSECPSCGGTGYEPCLCMRWSDGDAGCNTCSKTGYMACRACRGGGTAIPLYARQQRLDRRQ
mmetsp:Transcript_63624/g.139457  ORF Transcript_63624/g.139457 Transcript_63624/m.139457 type:complete len:159 (+) Transcript_63624:169-645(+)